MLGRLGFNASDENKLREAIDAFHQALQEYTRERLPIRWASTQQNLGLNVLALSQFSKDIATVEQSIQALRLALEVYEEAGAVHYAAGARASLAVAQTVLKQKQRN